MPKLFIAVALTVILIVLSVVHYIVFQAMILAIPISSHELLLAVYILYAVLTLSFIVATLISHKWNTLCTRILYRLSATWLGFLTYFFFAACVSIIYSALVAPSFFVSGIIFAIAVVLGVWGLIQAEVIREQYVRIRVPNLPVQWKNRKIMFMSDLHLGQVHQKAFSERVVKRIEAAKPDMVLIGGDIYDGVAVDEQEVVEPFRALQIPFGIFFVMGNHEEFSDNSKYLNALRNVGMKVLLDEVVNVDGLTLIGVDYKTTEKRAGFEEVLSKLSANFTKPNILMKHVPQDIDMSEKYGIDLQLSGHTHRAQQFPFSLLTRFIFKGYDYGLNTFKAMNVYTSSGLGTWGPPMRVGTVSEIVSIELI